MGSCELQSIRSIRRSAVQTLGYRGGDWDDTPEHLRPDTPTDGYNYLTIDDIVRQFKG
jgi:hypothetical protein